MDNRHRYSKNFTGHLLCMQLKSIILFSIEREINNSFGDTNSRVSIRKRCTVRPDLFHIDCDSYTIVRVIDVYGEFINTKIILF